MEARVAPACGDYFLSGGRGVSWGGVDVGGGGTNGSRHLGPVDGVSVVRSGVSVVRGGISSAIVWAPVVCINFEDAGKVIVKVIVDWLESLIYE